MQFQTKLILLFVLILVSFTMGCDPEFKNPCTGSWISRCAANTEILIIGPYRTDCVGAFEQDCFLEYNEESQRWFFFYDGIKGFDFEPGFIYRLKVSLHEYAVEYQDIGKYEYRLIEVLNKEEMSVDEKPPRNPPTEWIDP